MANLFIIETSLVLYETINRNDGGSTDHYSRER